MVISDRKKLDDIGRWASDIVRSDAVVLVEGPKDEVALKLLGIEKVYALNKQPLYVVVEELSLVCSEVILLTDIDVEGDKLFTKLRCDFIASGVKVVVSFREWLSKNTSVRQVEDLSGYVLNLKKKLGFEE